MKLQDSSSGLDTILRIILRCIVLGSVLFSFAACSSFPPAVPVSNWLSIVPDNAGFLIFVKEASVRGILFEEYAKRLGLRKEAFGDIEKSTELVLIWGTDDAARGRTITIILIGGYSSWSIELGLKNSGLRSESESTYTIWKDKLHNVSIANPRGYMIVITNGRIEETLARIDSGGDRTWKSPDTLSLIENSDAALYLGNPGSASFFSMLNKERIPLDEILVTLGCSDQGKRILSRFVFENKQDNRVFETSLKTFIVWLMRKCGIENFTRRISIEDKGPEVDAVFSKYDDEELGKMFRFMLDWDEKKSD